MAFNPTLKHLTTRLDGGVVWAASTEYLADNVVIYLDASYRCLVNHTAGSSFVTDLLANKWVKLSASEINYIANSSALVDTSGYSAYADAAGAAPVDGAGGSPSVTFTRSTTSPLRGIADFNFTKPAGASHQGNGVSYDFTIDNADLAKVLTVTFDYEVVSGTYSDGDLTVYIIQDPNGTPVVIQPAGYTILSGTAGTKLREIATFQTASNVTSYRLCFHCASSTNTNAYVIAMDNISVSPQTTVQGAAVSDWQSYTPTGSWTSNTSYSGRYRRVGDSVDLQYTLTLSGAPNAANLTLNMPSGMVIDTSKLSSNFIFAGGGNGADVGVQPYGQFFLEVLSSTSFIVRYQSSVTAVGSPVSNTAPFSWGNTDIINLRATDIPISGWSSNTVLSQDTDTRVVAARMIRGTTQALVTGDNKILLSSATFDTHAAFDAVNSRYIAPVSGYYEISASIEAQGSATADLGFGYRLNGSGAGTTIYCGSDAAAPATPSTFINGNDSVFLNAGSYIEFYQYISSATGTLGTRSKISVKRLSGPATIAASESVIASYLNVGGLVVPQLAVTTISSGWTTKLKDTHNAFSNGVFTVPISGSYAVSGGFILNSAVNAITGDVSVIASQAGSASTFVRLGAVIVNAAYTGFAGVLGGTHIFNCIAGDTITISAYQSATAPSRTIHADTSWNKISIVRVGN